MTRELYDRIGTTYTATRAPDPRIAAAIDEALGDARTVVNVGAGAGSYEPRAREVTAVEPSETMVAQRPPGAAPVVRAHAESLPFADGEFDAAMAVLADHHFADRGAGLREMRRVARDRVVLLTFDITCHGDGWLTRDYLTRFVEMTAGTMRIEEICAHLGGAEARVVPIPHDCRDGFLQAYWRRPEAYLDPRVRAGISTFSALEPEEVDRGMAALEADLRSGAWHERNADLLDHEAIDVGYRLVVACR